MGANGARCCQSDDDGAKHEAQDPWKPRAEDAETSFAFGDAFSYKYIDGRHDYEEEQRRRPRIDPKAILRSGEGTERLLEETSVRSRQRASSNVSVISESQNSNWTNGARSE